MLYNELVQLGETQENFTILTCIPNSNYVAKWRYVVVIIELKTFSL